VQQYGNSKKAHAVNNLDKNPVFSKLAQTILCVKTFKKDRVHQNKLSEHVKNETCYACHGTRVGVKGQKKIQSEVGEISLPVLTNWPNQGVGRHNPDGSLGACTACHPRHSFSIEIARKPHTCGQCHLEPDVPAYPVYKESKHGNIYSSTGYRWNWNAVPWKVGKDFKAPTCAACHNSLLISPEGETIAVRNHDFSNRLWTRLFGLIYAHPQPRHGKTFEIKNADGQPLPATYAGKLASKYLIGNGEQKNRRKRMTKICGACHSATWVQGHLVRLDSVCDESNRMVYTTTQLLNQAWKKGLADKSNPFDEPIELDWVRQWLFYANSLRYGAAMSGPDYAAFKNGFFEMTSTIAKMEELVKGQPKKRIKRRRKRK
jgi:hypothetical protein